MDTAEISKYFNKLREKQAFVAALEDEIKTRQNTIKELENEIFNIRVEASRKFEDTPQMLKSLGFYENPYNR